MSLHVSFLVHVVWIVSVGRRYVFFPFFDGLFADMC